MNIQLLRYLAHSFWAVINREHLLLLFKAAITDQKKPAENLAQDWPDDGTKVQMTGSIAVIPMYGDIFPRDNLYTMFCGGATIERMRRQFRKALADESVRAIVFKVDSPGGLVDGVTEFAQEIFQARGQKPIFAIADTLMASSAYWLSASADQIIATPSSTVGSIGVYSLHEDISGLLAAEGVKITLIASDERKVEGNPYEPLSDEARSEIKARVDETAAQFRVDVGRGRGITAAAVKANYGEGRVFSAKEGKRLGLIDRVETFDQLVGRLTGKRKMNGSISGATYQDDQRVSATIGDKTVLLPKDVVLEAMATDETDDEIVPILAVTEEAIGRLHEVTEEQAKAAVQEIIANADERMQADLDDMEMALSIASRR